MAVAQENKGVSVFEITAPDGAVYEIEAPEGASEEDVLQFAQANVQGQPKYGDPTLAERAGGGIMGVQQGISMGFGDELQAGLTAAGTYALDKLGIDQLLTGKEYEKGFQETYENDLAKTRQRMAQAAEQTPVEYTGGQVVGGLATVPATLATAPGRALQQGVTQGPLLSRMLYGGTGGAVSGGVYGFGTGEGGFEQRLESAQTGSIYGGVGGGAIPAIGTGARGVKEAVLPQIDDALKPLAKRANDLGIPLSIDQLSPTKFRRTVQKVSQEAPFAGVDDFIDVQRKAFNRALAKTIGQNADNLAPDVIERFSRDASKKFGVLTRGVNVQVGDDFAARLNTIVDEAFANSGDEVGNIVQRQAAQLLKEMPAETLRGGRVATARSNILKKLAGRKLNPQSKEYVKEMVDLIDNTVAPYLDDAKKATLQQARREYRNFKTIEPLLEGSTDGSINPTQLLNRVKASPYIRASRAGVGDDELVDLARIGKEFLPIPGGSDTFQKGALGYGLVSTIGGVIEPITLAFSVGGVGLNRGFQKLYNQNPRLVQKLLLQGQKSGNFKPLIRASARQAGVKAANEDKINQNIIQRLMRDESGSVGGLDDIDLEKLLAETKNVTPKAIKKVYSNGKAAAQLIKSSRPEIINRANKLGFDTSRVVYRGLGKEYDPSRASMKSYQMFTHSGAQAGEYALGAMGKDIAPNVVPAFIRKGKNLKIDAAKRNFNALPVSDVPDDVARYIHPSLQNQPISTDVVAHAAKKAGYDSVTVRNVFDNAWGERTGSPTTIDIVFDPKNIRSVNAKFDPAKAASSDILAQRLPLTAGAGGAAGLAATQPEQAEAGIFDDFDNMQQEQQMQNVTDFVNRMRPPQEGYMDLRGVGGDLSDNRQAPQSVVQKSAVDSLLDKIAFAESSGNPNAKAATSSASGLFQFTDPTWRRVVDKWGKREGIKFKDKNDPEAQRVMAKLLLEDNANYLRRKLKIEPSEQDIYIAHFLGAPMATKFLRALERDPIAKNVVPEAAKANKSIFYDGARPRRVSEVYNLLAKKVT